MHMRAILKSQLGPVLRASSRVAASPTATLPRRATTARWSSRRQTLVRYMYRPYSSQTDASSSSSSSSASPDVRQHMSLASFLAWLPAEPVAGVTAHGHVRSVRSMKRVSFVTLGDGSTLAPFQAVVPAHLAQGITNGAAVRFEGTWGPSEGGGQSHELQVESVAVLGPSDAKTFPIQKKYQTPEYLRTLPHLRPRIATNAMLLRFRSDVIASLNRFFAERDFVQTHPPLITSSDCEGAGEVFSVAAAHDESHDESHAKVSDADAAGFFRAPKYLTVSTQLHLEALAQAVGSVWTLSPTFRAEASDTPRHLSEFYMLEAEACFVDRLDAVMDVVEDMLRFVAHENKDSRVRRELQQHRELQNQQKQQADGSGAWEDQRVVEQRWQGLLAPARWPRITYTDAVALLQAAPVAFEHAPTWGTPLQTEHEKYLADIVGGGGAGGTNNKMPVFVTHYPRESKAFYMLPTTTTSATSTASAGETVDCFDLLVPDFCEIAGGSMREHRLAELVRTMQARGMPVGGGVSVEGNPSNAAEGEVEDALADGGLGWYVDLRRWGCPPHGGFGLGFDRLLCYLTGVQTLRDMVAFPRWHGRCDC